MSIGIQQPDTKPAVTSRQILVIGLGNPLLGDDGFGWRVAQEVQRVLHDVSEGEGLRPSFIDNVAVDYLSVGGLRLMEHMVDYRTVIVIDAIVTGQQPVGSLYTCALDDLPHPFAGHMRSVHDTTLQTALSMGRAMGVALPDTIWIVGVEVEPTYEFSDTLSPSISAVVARAVDMVIEKLCQEVT